MPLIKIGTKTVDGVERSVFLMQGNAVRDAEFKEVGGTKMGKVTVAAMERADGDTMFVTLTGWRYKAKDVSAIRKMDSVLAVGVLKNRIHNEREYWDMDADFVIVSGVGGSARRSSTPDSFGGVGYAGDSGLDGLEEVGVGDGELPF